MVGAVALRVLLALALAGRAADGTGQGQPSPYDAMTSAERRVIAGWMPGATTTAEREAQLRQRYNAADPSFHTRFRQVTQSLAALQLFDPENGEVLGAAIDLIETVEPPERQPSADAAATALPLLVALAPGARDRLRRSAEFERIGDTDGMPGPSFHHAGPPAIRFVLRDGGSRAMVTILSP